MKFAACIFLKVLQIVVTVSATILKKLSDRYSERLVTSNKKNLREWMLLNTISLTKEADDFGDLAYIGYVFISSILLLSRFKEKTRNYHITEIILLSFGVLFFIIQGLLIFGIIEELQDNILDFGYSLGAVTFLCAILFAIDLFFFKQMADPKNAISQTDLENAIEAPIKEVYQVTNIPKVNSLEQCCHPSATKNVRKLKYLRTDL
ncbi:PREDICTED: uncharacterized protein LOC108614951 [Drosophila arizonae]|uniref:Uncharacterized protein LOC108614951 n=1 Tax=Drosophila arizonae TaxID=7263 RepID=A0ABM1PBS4_DROAR|nr:PREDICTED: uncharacterized protein LOC108614951 [Drosophila arizonae]